MTSAAAIARRRFTNSHALSQGLSQPDLAPTQALHTQGIFLLPRRRLTVRWAGLTDRYKKSNMSFVKGHIEYLDKVRSASHPQRDAYRVPYCVAHCEQTGGIPLATRRRLK